jgi:hypothetical protein
MINEALTLIVGLRTGLGVQILSDTRISHPDVTQEEEVPGRLKIITVRPDLCVAYSGRANFAIDTVRSVASDPGCNFESALSILLAAHGESRREVEFIAARVLAQRNVIRMRQV